MCDESNDCGTQRQTWAILVISKVSQIPAFSWVSLQPPVSWHVWLMNLMIHIQHVPNIVVLKFLRSASWNKTVNQDLWGRRFILGVDRLSSSHNCSWYSCQMAFTTCYTCSATCTPAAVTLQGSVWLNTGPPAALSLWAILNFPSTISSRAACNKTYSVVYNKNMQQPFIQTHYVMFVSLSVSSRTQTSKCITLSYQKVYLTKSTPCENILILCIYFTK